jgi:hypothetical protein
VIENILDKIHHLHPCYFPDNTPAIPEYIPAVTNKSSAGYPKSAGSPVPASFMIRLTIYYLKCPVYLLEQYKT